MKEFWGQSLGLDAAAVKRGLLMALAAWLAFAIASIWHMANAYWAAMAVWVVVQPLRGMLFERALMRVLGTALGAAVGFVILWCAPHALLQIVLLSLWATVCAGAMHLIKGIYPYGVMLAGITAGVVVLPSALTNSYQPDLAWSRVLCTLIGVLVVTIVMSFYTPKASRREYYTQARLLVADAVEFAVRLLQGAPLDAAYEHEQDVLLRMSQLESSAHTVAAGSVTGHRQLRHVEALIASSMEVMASAAAIYRQRQHEEGRTVQDEEVQILVDYMSQLTTQLRQDDEAFKALLQHPEVLLNHPPVTSDMAQRLNHSLEQLVAAEKALYHGVDKLEAGGRLRVSPPKLATAAEIDWAKQSALSAGVTTLAVSLLAWVSGSHAADLMALGTCMFCLILASFPYPRIMMKILFTGVVVGSVVALAYRLLIQPYVSTLPQLMLSLIPFLLVGGLARTSSKTAGPALDANMNFFLVGQIMFPAVAATTGQIVVDSVAVVLGVAGACLASLWLLPRRADDQAYMTVTKLIRDLQRMLERSGDYFSKYTDAEKDWQARSEREVLRMMLHLGAAKALRNKAPLGILGVLNLGSVIVRLQRLRTPVAQQGLQALTYFADDTHGAIRAVWNLAKENADDPASDVLYEAVDALTACERLLQFARKPSKEALKESPQA
ncbi:p-hydroxybenzoic acid efflux pump subunit AaeB [Saezia sanguinis]|uniref:p-hydroxybenzoic acid efflux pump subunit AaeB n=1 Tax=Saezia sanguinis TaxID=1965230 RepID=A0A433SDR2_9BURK|nr:FUSC family protein [Saezia sanguinis]RUS66774.1 p-hydroxybenzoic acid efflux pump subunit AaeB [Saezia sanguinis]